MTTTNASDNIQILEFQKPALESGTYRVDATQLFAPTPDAKPIPYKASQELVVRGARFAINPGQVRAQFPPAGSLGVYNRTFPHISLRSATLPWERSAYGTVDDEPWMVLLAIDETDIQRGDVMIPKDAVPLGAAAADPGFAYDMADPHLDRSALVTTISVRPAFLSEIMPSGPAMKLQAHVRRRTAPNSGTSRELAVIFANRLPRPDSSTYCFLVSVEGLYDQSGQFANRGRGEYRTLVALSGWNFASFARNGKNFENLSADLDSGPLAVDAPSAVPAAQAMLAQGAVMMRHDMRTSDRTWSWYRGPLSPSAGPAMGADPAGPLPVFSDELLIFDGHHAIFDVSHAAAFTLGRALALNDNGFTTALYSFKENANRKTARQLERQATETVLVGSTKATFDQDINEHEELLSTWLAGLARLENVPFNYLVPDAAMLPSESIRFFRLDQAWVDASLAGAFSIGGTLRDQVVNRDLIPALTEALAAGALPEPDRGIVAAALQVNPKSLKVSFDPETRRGSLRADDQRWTISTRAGQLVVRDPGLSRRHFEALRGDANSTMRSGVLLRSRLVSGWPDMMIDAFDARPDTRGANQLTNLRATRLGPDTLLLIFDGDLAAVELYLKPEGLQFGVDEHSDRTHKKDVETAPPTRRKPASRVAVPVPFSNHDERIVDMVQLCAEMKKVLPRTAQFDGADFGMQMFEGASKTMFLRVDP